MKKVLVTGFIALLVAVFVGLPLFASKAQDNAGSSKNDPTIIDKFLTEGQVQKTIRPVAKAVEEARTAGVEFEKRDVFTADVRRTTADPHLRQALTDGTLFELNKEAIQKILKNDTNFMTLQMPATDGTMVELELVKVNIFADGFSVKTSAPAPEVTGQDLGVHYQGIVKGDPYSIAAVSVFKNEVAGFYYNEDKGNNVLGRLRGNNPKNTHVLYADKNLLGRPDKYCAVKDEPQRDLPISLLQEPESIQSICVRMYLEANYDLFQDQGTVAATTAYIAAFFNQSATLYRNEAISMSISEMFVWNSPSPYTSSSSSTTLNQFRATRTSFNGNLAHFLTLRNFGGIAYLNVICNTGFRYGVSGISFNFANVPTYSWTVDVFTHEVGHNLGSSHTHACVWNGNNTAIDSCGPDAGFPYEGACSGAPSPAPGQGTIMSYCHLTSGKNFALGFGPQPQAVIQNRVAAATCLTDCGSATTVNFTTTNYTINESGTVATVLVSRQGTSAGASVSYATSNGTATAGQDYTAVSGTLNFAANETIKSFTIPIADDAQFEQGETINVTLSNPGGGITIGTPGTSTVTIANNDPFVAGKRFDYDGDGKADISVYRPAGGVWFVQNSSNGSVSINSFGLSDDLTVPADYDGDQKTDIAIYRPSNGCWFWLNSSNGTLGGNMFGVAEDKPVPGDYEGDGKADIGIYRPSTGTWWIYRSSDGGVAVLPFGTAEDKPTLGDFDGDNRADLAVFRPSNGVWYRTNSSTQQFIIVSFGLSEDKPTPADYDGDGKTDIAVFRPSNGAWYWINSSNDTVGGVLFGLSEDKPVPADYDGDGKADQAVFRPSQGFWYLLRSTAGFTGQEFGASGDIPTPNSFVQ